MIRIVIVGVDPILLWFPRRPIVMRIIGVIGVATTDSTATASIPIDAHRLKLIRYGNTFATFGQMECC